MRKRAVLIEQQVDEESIGYIHCPECGLLFYAGSLEEVISHQHWLPEDVRSELIMLAASSSGEQERVLGIATNKKL